MYTFIMNYLGGTYISQGFNLQKFDAEDIQAAMRLWIQNNI